MRQVRQRAAHSNSTRAVPALAALTAALLATAPAAARQADRPITDSEPDVMDVAKTPMTDLNLEKVDIPPLLKTAIRKPYTLEGVKTCGEISAAVEKLDAVLGPDIDLPSEGRDMISAGRVAKWAVSSFIPFRGLIREISGANAQDQAVLAAARAGIARRAFLKGVGEAKGCRYPASPASPAVIQARALALHRQQEKHGRVAAPQMTAAALLSPGAEDEDRLTARPTSSATQASAAPSDNRRFAAADAGMVTKASANGGAVPFTSVPVVQKVP